MPGTGPSSINRINRQRQVTLTGNMLPGGSQAAVILSQLNQARQRARHGTRLPLRPRRRLQRTRPHRLLLHAGVLAHVHLHVHRAGRAVRIVHPPHHDSAHAAARRPLRHSVAAASPDQTVNIFSGLGLLLLFGIVKKNAILQIDHTNGLRAAGMNRYDAIIQANRDRLRPILMTTIALVAGMVPLVISRGTGAATNRSIGVLVVGGQSLCLLLTLLAVPVFYSLFEDLGDSFVHRPRRAPVRLAGRRSRRLPQSPPPLLARSPRSSDRRRTQVARLQPAEGVEVKPRIGISARPRIRLPEVIERVLANDPDLADLPHSTAGGRLPHPRRAGLLRPVARPARLPHHSVTARGVHPRRHGQRQAAPPDSNFTPQVSGIFPCGGTYTLSFNNRAPDHGQHVQHAQPAVSHRHSLST